MTTIQIDVPDDLLKEMGRQSIQMHLQKSIELMRLEVLSEKIDKAYKENDVDVDKELEAAKDRAWKKFKSHYNEVRR